jgi:hypothetical protein
VVGTATFYLCLVLRMAVYLRRDNAVMLLC